jgi:PAS domain S-box-containing protein
MAASGQTDLEKLVEHLPDVIFRVDGELRVVFISAGVERFTGIPPRGYLGKTVREMGVDPAACDRLEEGARRVLARGLPESIEFADVGRVFRARLFPELDETGRAVALTGIIDDVTERTRLEEQLRYQASLLDLLGDPAVATDEAFRITTWNRAAESTYGFTHGEAIGRKIDHLLQTEFPNGVEEIARPLRERGAARVELVHHTKQGGRLRVQAHVVVLLGPGSAFAGTLGILRDITDAKRIEEALRDSDRRKTEFLAVLSHELRNPLAPIHNAIYLLRRSPPGSEVALRAQEVLHRQTDQLRRLVDDLLDISRIDHGKIELQLTTVDPREIARRSCADCRSLFEERGVDLVLAESAEAVWVRADPARLAQMVHNLLGNALKFTSPGGRVHVAVEQRDGACEVSVRDDGVGIEPENLGRIFEPFVQAAPARHGQGGLGIGLALVRELAIRQGGTVRAQSHGPGTGAELTIHLPCVAPPASSAEDRAPSPSSGPLSVLLVEDNEDAASTLADLLTLQGHQVALAPTGRDGIEAAAVLPDVVICDIKLPDMSGHEVIRSVRSLPGGRGVFAIALTGYAQPHDRDLAIAAGFDAHLGKPASAEELEELLLAAAGRPRPPSGGPAPSSA